MWADNGFATANDDTGLADGSNNAWEPDGTPFSESKSYFTFGNGPVPSVTWTFNLAASGVDLPDGSVINGVYAIWSTRGSDGITWQYTEGTASDSTTNTQGSSPIGDLVLSWTDDLSTVRNSNFQRIFTGPIVVEGGDGFELRGTDNQGNAAHIDAVVIDVTLPATGAPIIVPPTAPADEATDVPVNTALVATFDKPIDLDRQRLGNDLQCRHLVEPRGHSPARHQGDGRRF